MSTTRSPAEAHLSTEIDSSTDGAPAPVLQSLSVVQAEMDATILTCEDCDVVLTEGNTRVTYEEAFWLGAVWTSEQYCETCKDRREADGPSDSAISYDAPDASWYREQLCQAGRGHLLG
jgi:hypothetical protein